MDTPRSLTDRDPSAFLLVLTDDYVQGIFFYGLFFFFSKLEKHICGNMSPEWIINTIYAQKKTNV